jgi:hypothetical protein
MQKSDSIVLHPKYRQPLLGISGYFFCVYTKDTAQSLIYFRNKKPYFKPKKVENDLITTNQPSSCEGVNIFFGGILQVHFGHFLVEQFLNIILSNVPAGATIYFYGDKILDFHKRLLSLIGITDICLIRYPVRVLKSNLIKMNYIIGDITDNDPLFREKYMSRFENTNIKHTSSYKKVWVSRRKLDITQGGLSQETLIEENLSKDGWDIFHPQEHSIGEQLELYSKCFIIAGIQGSAIHLPQILFPKVKIYLFSFEKINTNFIRLSNLSTGQIIPTYIKPIIHIGIKSRKLFFCREKSMVDICTILGVEWSSRHIFYSFKCTYHFLYGIVLYWPKYTLYIFKRILMYVR